jgi:hypothetical protein
MAVKNTKKKNRNTGITKFVVTFYVNTDEVPEVEDAMERAWLASGDVAAIWRTKTKKVHNATVSAMGRRFLRDMI